jgi:hypothetical protein
LAGAFGKREEKKRKEKQESVQKGRRQARKRLKRAGIYEHVLGIFVARHIHIHQRICMEI